MGCRSAGTETACRAGRLGCVVDTVENAAITPDEPQPWAELGLTSDEYELICRLLSRRPTSAELAMYSVMWSEHCSYKSSKLHLKRFAEAPQATPRGPLLAGIGDNAGVVAIGGGWAVTFKLESHNHPSFVEPYQGAATGTGGIVRDILAMGARPIGVMDALHVGPLDADDTRRVLPGVVAGVGGYGNCLGLPTIGGELIFDECYAGNPLVNVLCVGLLRHEDLRLAKASGVGNLVVMYGARTGGDGIGGASILASDTFDDAKKVKRPSVQVGDPFMEKLLIEATLELFHAGLVQAIQDFGAAGISCATSELAAAGKCGMTIELDAVALRDPLLTPEEILMSESQERMMAIVTPSDLDAFMAIADKWEVEARVIGVLTDDARLRVTWGGQTIVNVNPETVAGGSPMYDRPAKRPDWLDELRANHANQLGRAKDGTELTEQILAVVRAPNQASKAWVTDQYDRFVRGATVLAQPEDAGMLRTGTGNDYRGIALSCDASGPYTLLDPYLGAQLALAESYRNVATTGAQPIAITDCLNFGSPEEPEVMWAFTEAIRGLVDGCNILGLPVTGGNVSFYNRTGASNIKPTPVVGVLGVINDVRRRNKTAFTTPGDTVCLLGVTHEELGGSAWAAVVHKHLGGLPPFPRLAAEKDLASVLVKAASRRLLSSAHDLSEGGLSQAVVECCLMSGLGAQVELSGELDATAQLFSESPGRVLVSLPPDDVDKLISLCAEHDVPCEAIGQVTAEPSLVIGDLPPMSLVGLSLAWETTIPMAMGD